MVPHLTRRVLDGYAGASFYFSESVVVGDQNQDVGRNNCLLGAPT